MMEVVLGSTSISGLLSLSGGSIIMQCIIHVNDKTNLHSYKNRFLSIDTAFWHGVDCTCPVHEGESARWNSDLMLDYFSKARKRDNR